MYEGCTRDIQGNNRLASPDHRATITLAPRSVQPGSEWCVRGMRDGLKVRPLSWRVSVPRRMLATFSWPMQLAEATAQGFDLLLVGRLLPLC